MTPPRGAVTTPRRRRVLAAIAVTAFLALPAAAQQIDPNVPVNINQQDLGDLPLFLDRVLDNVINGSGAAATMLNTGNQIWRGLALILIVWTGARVAYSGNFQPWDIVKLLVALWWPWFMLQTYDIPIPGIGLSFPQTIAGGGDWIAGLFAADIVSLVLSELSVMMAQQLTQIEVNWSEFSLWQLFRGGSQLFIVAAQTTVVMWAFMLGMIVVVALALAQVLFAKTAVAVLVAIGPMLIPFMLVPKMEFLFWGWFKALIQFSLYSAIAVVMMRIWCAVMLGYTTTLANTPYEFSSGIWLGAWGVALVVVIVCAIVSILKVGDLAGMIVGAGSDGGGFIAGAFVASRLVTAPARVIAPMSKGVPTP